MKMTFSKLIRYARGPELPLEPLSPAQAERIRELTMKKIAAPAPKRRLRPLRIALVAAVTALALCGSAFAAYESGWFSQLFGQEASQVDAYVETFSAQESATTGSQASASYSAETLDYRFTLDSLLAGSDTVYGVIKMEPLTEYGAANMDLDVNNGLDMAVTNLSDSEGGSTTSSLLSVEEDATYYLVTSTGGDNAVGDILCFQIFSITESDGTAHAASLFNAEITEVLDTEATIALDTSVYDGHIYYYDALTVTPLSMTLTGAWDYETFEASMVDNGDETITVNAEEPQMASVSITLKDGTSFSLDENWTPYGTYGCATKDYSAKNTGDGEVTFTIAFSQVVDIEQIAEITVDGVSYTLD